MGSLKKREELCTASLNLANKCLDSKTLQYPPYYFRSNQNWTLSWPEEFRKSKISCTSSLTPQQDCIPFSTSPDLPFPVIWHCVPFWCSFNQRKPAFIKTWHIWDVFSQMERCRIQTYQHASLLPLLVLSLWNETSEYTESVSHTWAMLKILWYNIKLCPQQNIKIKPAWQNLVEIKQLLKSRRVQGWRLKWS